MTDNFLEFYNDGERQKISESLLSRRFKFEAQDFSVLCCWCEKISHLVSTLIATTKLTTTTTSLSIAEQQQQQQQRQHNTPYTLCLWVFCWFSQIVPSASLQWLVIREGGRRSEEEEEDGGTTTTNDDEQRQSQSCLFFDQILPLLVDVIVQCHSTVVHQFLRLAHFSKITTAAPDQLNERKEKINRLLGNLLPLLENQCQLALEKYLLQHYGKYKYIPESSTTTATMITTTTPHASLQKAFLRYLVDFGDIGGSGGSSLLRQPNWNFAGSINRWYKLFSHPHPSNSRGDSSSVGGSIKYSKIIVELLSLLLQSNNSLICNATFLLLRNRLVVISEEEEPVEEKEKDENEETVRLPAKKIYLLFLNSLKRFSTLLLLQQQQQQRQLKKQKREEEEVKKQQQSRNIDEDGVDDQIYCSIQILRQFLVAWLKIRDFVRIDWEMKLSEKEAEFRFYTQSILTLLWSQLEPNDDDSQKRKLLETTISSRAENKTIAIRALIRLLKKL